jgi:putative DNA primase/helicase
MQAEGGEPVSGSVADLLGEARSGDDEDEEAEAEEARDALAPRGGPALARTHNGQIILPASAPWDVAQVFMKTVHEGGTLVHWQGQHYRFDGGSGWRPLSKIALNGEVYRFLDRAVVRREGGGYSRYQPDDKKVGKVCHAVTALVDLPELERVPAWIRPEAGDPPVRELVAVQNGLLHLPSRTLMAPTPRLFWLGTLAFGYDAAARCPEWEQFISEVWGDDAEAMATVQEMFGLCVTDVTEFQKGFIMVGPPRSGKGTTARVLQGLVGEANYIGPSMRSIVREHGLQNWIGKKVAVFSDVRMEHSPDAVTELVLRIIGEDVIDVDRKWILAWTGVLSARVLLLSNELPRFKDETGTVASRFIVLEMLRSWLGREDRGLLKRLLGELPGVLNWALDGWDALVERGHFVQPECGREAAETLVLLISNMKAFVAERCEVGPEYRIEVGALERACREWHGDRGLRYAMTRSHLSARLERAVPGVGTERPRAGATKERPRWFTGLRLRTELRAVPEVVSFVSWRRR